MTSLFGLLQTIFFGTSPKRDVIITQYGYFYRNEFMYR